MTGKIGRKKVLKFRDFPTRLRGEVFFVENGYDEKLNLSIINHLVDINNLFIGKSIHFNLNSATLWFNFISSFI